MANALIIGRSGSAIGMDFVGEGAPAAPAGPLGVGTIVAPPQQSRARELAGYGVVFVSLAALLVSAPQQAGAANYTIGTHGAALASMQPQPQVWGSAPAPVVEPAFSLRLVIAGPQEYVNVSAFVHGPTPDSISALIGSTKVVVGPDQTEFATLQRQPLVWGPTPEPVASDVPLKTLLTLPQQTDAAYGLVWGPQPDGIDTQPPRTWIAAPEQRDQAYGTVWRLPLPPALVDDPVGSTLAASPQQVDPAYGLVWGLQPDSIDVQPPRTLVATPEQVGISYAKVWQLPASLVPVDDPVGSTFVAPPQQVIQTHFTYWGTTPVPDASTVVLGTLYASYQEFDPAYALVWGLPPPSVPADPVSFGTFVVTQQVPDLAYAVLWGLTPPEVVVDAIFRSTLVAGPGYPEQKHFTYWGVTPVPVVAGDTIFHRTLFAAWEHAVAELRFPGLSNRLAPYLPPSIVVTPAIVRPGGRIVIPPNTPGEPVLARFDFLSSIGRNNSIVSAVVTAVVYSGIDSNPAAILDGVATIEGTMVLQSVNEGISGVVYRLLCRITVTSGHTPEMSGYYTVPQPKGI